MVQHSCGLYVMFVSFRYYERWLFERLGVRGKMKVCISWCRNWSFLEMKPLLMAVMWRVGSCWQPILTWKEKVKYIHIRYSKQVNQLVPLHCSWRLCWYWYVSHWVRMGIKRDWSRSQYIKVSQPFICASSQRNWPHRPSIMRAVCFQYRCS